MPDRRQGDRRQGDRRQGDRRETVATPKEPITLSLKTFIIILVISVIIILSGTAFIVNSIMSNREKNQINEYVEEDDTELIMNDDALDENDTYSDIDTDTELDTDADIDETEDFSDDESVEDETIDEEILDNEVLDDNETNTVN